jgi:hypothetical protein
MSVGTHPIIGLFRLGPHRRLGDLDGEGRSTDARSKNPSVEDPMDEKGQAARTEKGPDLPPPVSGNELQITEAITVAVNGAFANRTPITVAYVDRDGQPHLSLRGTTQVFGGDQLAIWIRNPEGGLLSAIETNPRLALLYRDPATRTTYQFHGRAHADRSRESSDRVYSNSPEFERGLDPDQRGVAVVVDLDQIQGRDAAGFFLMQRSADT